MTKAILIAGVTALLAGTTLLGTGESASASNKFCRVNGKIVSGAQCMPKSSLRCINNRCTLLYQSDKAKARAARRAIVGRHGR
jgi:hypothetical protein